MPINKLLKTTARIESPKLSEIISAFFVLNLIANIYGLFREMKSEIGERKEINKNIRIWHTF